MVTNHKDGTPSQNCTIANTIAYRSIDVSGSHVVEHHNYVVGRDNSARLYDLFINPDELDFHLLNNTLTRNQIIGQGEPFTDRISSQLDYDNAVRKNLPDLGAFEAE